jgi:hypothetical protein
MSTPNQQTTAQDVTINSEVLPVSTTTTSNEENDNEKQEKEATKMKKQAALDPPSNTIVCSFCNLPETATRNFDNLRCPCKSTQYCNTTCQKKHWNDHKKNHLHLIAERRRKKKLDQEKEQRDCTPNSTTTSTVNEEAHDPKMTKREQVNEGLQPCPRCFSEQCCCCHPTDLPTEQEDERKEEATSGDKPKKKEKEDECCICLENLPKDATKFNRMTCCGNGMHIHCNEDLKSMKMSGSCPLCRAKTPTSDQERLKQLRPWVKKKKAWAQNHMAQHYRDGKGVKQSYEMATRLYKQAAEQAAVSAMFDLGQMYYYGEGVEQSYEKSFEYFKQAAHLGLADAQFNLGVMYLKGEGVEEDITKAKQWLVAAAAQGEKASLCVL